MGPPSASLKTTPTVCVGKTASGMNSNSATPPWTSPTTDAVISNCELTSHWLGMAPFEVHVLKWFKLGAGYEYCITTTAIAYSRPPKPSKAKRGPWRDQPCKQPFSFICKRVSASTPGAVADL